MTTLRPKISLKNGGATPTGAINRDIDSKLIDIISVKDFGAVGDGTTDDTAAFQAAINSVASGGLFENYQRVLVPNGHYNIAGTLTPAATSICWDALGAFKVDGITPLDLPGTVISYRAPGYVNIIKSNGDLNGFAELNVERTVSASGGTGGYVNTAGRFVTTVGAGDKSFEWALLSILNNSSTSTDAAQNVASYFQAKKLSSGITLGSVVELIDTLPGPATSSVTQELDLRATGGDPNNNRVITHMIASSYDGNAAAVHRGLWITTDSHTTIGNPIEFQSGGNFVNYIVSDNLNIKANGYSSFGPLGYAGTSYAAMCVSKASTDGVDLFQGYTDGTKEIVILQNGNVQNANNSYGAISDAKLKQNVSLSDSQWNDVKALGALVKKFSLVSDKTNTLQIGMIAQDVQTISPKLVYSTPDKDSEGNLTGTETLGVNYSVMYMKAFKALGEALIRIESLEARLNSANIA
jgi:hypothetical protein